MFQRFVYDCSQQIGHLEMALRTEDPIAVEAPQSFLDGGKLQLILKCARNHLDEHPNHPAGPLLKKLAETALSADVHIFFAAARTPTGEFSENPILKQNGKFRTQKEFFDRLRKCGASAEIFKIAFLFVVAEQQHESIGMVLVHLYLCFPDFTINYSLIERCTAELWIASS